MAAYNTIPQMNWMESDLAEQLTLFKQTMNLYLADEEIADNEKNLLTLSGPGYLMPLRSGGGGGTYAPLLISKSTNSILMTFYSTLYKNCSHYISAICFRIGLGLAEIIRCLCTNVVFFQIIGDSAVP